MNNDDTVILDFSDLSGPVHSGRAKGELARRTFELEELDISGVSVIVRIPENTYSVTTSFFLGLFGDSIRKAGSRSAFLDRYRFEAPDVFWPTFDTCISRALQEQSALVNRD